MNIKNVLTKLQVLLSVCVLSIVIYSPLTSSAQEFDGVTVNIVTHTGPQ